MPMLGTRGAGSSKGFGFTNRSTGPYVAAYLLVAGGGGGGRNHGGGGGGGGGVLSGTSTLTPGTTYTFVVGTGGTAGTQAAVSPTNGGNTTGLTLTAVGGGAGGG